VSILDRYFAKHASRGLSVVLEPVAGETTVEPGFVYRVQAAHPNAIYGIAAHPLAELVGKRIAFKVVGSDDSPGLLEVMAPEGYLLEDDGGELVSGLANAGLQLTGAYREWICDPDGNWLLISSAEGGEGIPLGQIVIKGTPVVIQGVPLVNTVPAPLAPATPRPLVATPATIVPRSAPVARPLGPSLLSGDVIELEDAFADASLEMDTAGEKFRVAEALQTQITTLDTDLTALETEVDGVQTDVAALEAQAEGLRFLFDLRKTTTVETDYEEIGVYRFDATPYGSAFTLVAELEASAAGQTVQLELWNLTAGTIVGTTLSTTAIKTTKVTAAITLPASEALYSVRLRRVGGSVNQYVSCRSVAFER
jgi:hypothetical protein